MTKNYKMPIVSISDSRLLMRKSNASGREENVAVAEAARGRDRGRGQAEGRQKCEKNAC